LSSYHGLAGQSLGISIPKSFLKEGAFHLQQINTVSTVKLVRRLGELNAEDWDLFYDRFFERFAG
jgi:mRNA-degrading endonuclease toxin of MazEF toxin-antitoxin module